MGKRVAALVVAVSTLALAGCETSGTAQRAPVELDTGGYKTGETDKGTGSAAWAAGAQLAAYVPYPSVIDKHMTLVNANTTPVGTVEALGHVIEGADAVPENKKFVFGFSSGASDSPKSEYSKRSLRIGVFRYSDPDAARAAVIPTAEAHRANQKALYERLDLEFDMKVDRAAKGYPTDSVTLTDTSGEVSMMVLVPHGRDVIMVHSYDRPLKESETTLHRALDLTIEQLARSSNVSEQTALDDAGLVTLTVPLSDDKSGESLHGAVVGPKSYAHVYNDPTRANQIFDDADVDLIARRATVVFRAGSAGKAADLGTSYGRWEREDGGARTVGSPRDLPTATCVEATTILGKSYSCSIVVDRYYARANSSKSLLDAQQQISAQYLILKERG